MNRAVGAHGLWADEPGPLAQAGMKRTFGPDNSLGQRQFFELLHNPSLGNDAD